MADLTTQFQKQLIGSQTTFVAADSTNTFWNGQGNINIFQSGTYSNTGPFKTVSGGYASGTVSIRDNVVNEENETQGNFIVIRSASGVQTGHYTVSDARDEIDNGGNYTSAEKTTLADFFVNNIIITDNDQFANTCAVTPGTSGGRGSCICDRVTPEDCAGDIPSTYKVELMSLVPKEIMESSVDLRYLELGDVNTNYGAN